jgi:purine-binding chemotaxis protein CheW
MSTGIVSTRNRHDPSKSLVGFVVGEVHYAVPIARVKRDRQPAPGRWRSRRRQRAVIGGRRVSRRGRAGGRHDGLRFGLDAARARTRRTKWIVVDVDEPLQSALVVDAVTEVFGTERNQELRPAAPTLGGGDDVRGIAGVTSYDGHARVRARRRESSASSPSRSLLRVRSSRASRRPIGSGSLPPSASSISATGPRRS